MTQEQFRGLTVGQKVWVQPNRSQWWNGEVVGVSGGTVTVEWDYGRRMGKKREDLTVDSEWVPWIEIVG